MEKPQDQFNDFCRKLALLSEWRNLDAKQRDKRQTEIRDFKTQIWSALTREQCQGIGIGEWSALTDEQQRDLQGHMQRHRLIMITQPAPERIIARGIFFDPKAEPNGSKTPLAFSTFDLHVPQSTEVTLLLREEGVFTTLNEPPIAGVPVSPPGDSPPQWRTKLLHQQIETLNQCGAPTGIVTSLDAVQATFYFETRTPSMTRPENAIAFIYVAYSEYLLNHLQKHFTSYTIHEKWDMLQNMYVRLYKKLEERRVDPNVEPVDSAAQIPHTNLLSYTISIARNKTFTLIDTDKDKNHPRIPIDFLPIEALPEHSGEKPIHFDQVLAIVLKATELVVGRTKPVKWLALTSICYNTDIVKLIESYPECIPLEWRDDAAATPNKHSVDNCASEIKAEVKKLINGDN